MPSDSAAAVSVDKAAEEVKEDILMDAASKVAAAAPSVSMDDRRKQAGKAAGRRFKSEAETRYLIDEQLRKVGWEADTEKLRYSRVLVLPRGTISPLQNGLRILPLATRAM